MKEFSSVRRGRASEERECENREGREEEGSGRERSPVFLSQFETKIDPGWSKYTTSQNPSIQGALFSMFSISRKKGRSSVIVACGKNQRRFRRAHLFRPFDPHDAFDPLFVTQAFISDSGTLAQAIQVRTWPFF